MIVKQSLGVLWWW